MTESRRTSVWLASRADDATLLSACPCAARESETLDDGCVAILVPRFDGAILGRWLMPRLRRPNFRVNLDEVGTFVWGLCNGMRTGDEIVEATEQRFPDMKDLRGRVALFLRRLLSQGHLAVRTPQEPSPTA